MSSKKLCSLGILDINLNFVLRKKQASAFNFNIDNYKTVEDLETLFYLKYESKKDSISIKDETERSRVNYLDFISLSSNNNLINTLLYINRAYKSKSFIEFIMPNQMEFSYTTKFIPRLLQEVFDNNYFFIVENKILDIPSKINFTIKILNDDNDNIISTKSFELFEMNEIDVEQTMERVKTETNEDEDSLNESENNNNDDDKNFAVEKVNYNFKNTDYFLIDFQTIKQLKLDENKNIIYFLTQIVTNFPKIKIVLIINEKINTLDRIKLQISKEILELADIIFSFQEPLNNFLKAYNNNFNSIFQSIFNNIKNNNDTHMIGNFKLNNVDLIINDEKKSRKNIPRITVIFENFNFVTIYRQQGTQMKLDYNESFRITARNNHKYSEFIYNNYYQFFHIFIGGFLSRIIHDKNLKVCFCAGDLIMKKCVPLLMHNVDYITDIEKYNVIVPSQKKSNKEKLFEKSRKEQQLLFYKEKKFVLDCTNKSKCQKKDYNPLLDKNCVSYFLKEYNLLHLKNAGFINKKGIILKDPDYRLKNKSFNNKKNKSFKYRNLTETNSYYNGFHSKSNNHTIYSTHTDVDNTQGSQSDTKFRPLFHFDNKYKNEKNSLSNEIDNPGVNSITESYSYLPQMANTCKNFQSENRRKIKSKNYLRSRNQYNQKSNTVNKKYSSLGERNMFNKKYHKNLFQLYRFGPQLDLNFKK